MDQISAQSPLLTPLKRIAHPQGDVYHGMKASDPGFAGFGEAYFSTILAGQTKGWKQHTQMQMNLVVPAGEVAFFVHDAASGHTTTYVLGAANYARLTIPPGFWLAFRGIGPGLNLVCNLASIEHRPEEANNVPLDTFALGLLP